MAAVKILMLSRREARAIIDELAASGDPQDRYTAALALFEVGAIESAAIPPDLVAKLEADDDELVRQQTTQVRPLITSLPSDAYGRHFRPFGL